MSRYTALNGNNFFLVNREIAHKIGLQETAFLAELTTKHDFFESRGELSTLGSKDGWFYLSIEEAYERSTLTKKQQEHAIKNLLRRRLIYRQTTFSPNRRYFKLNHEKIFELQKSPYEKCQKVTPEVPKSNSSPKGIYKRHHKETSSSTPSKPQASYESLNPTKEEDEDVHRRLKNRKSKNPIQCVDLWKMTCLINIREERKAFEDQANEKEKLIETLKKKNKSVWENHCKKPRFKNGDLSIYDEENFTLCYKFGNSMQFLSPFMSEAEWNETYENWKTLNE